MDLKRYLFGSNQWKQRIFHCRTIGQAVGQVDKRGEVRGMYQVPLAWCEPV